MGVFAQSVFYFDSAYTYLEKQNAKVTLFFYIVVMFYILIFVLFIEMVFEDLSEIDV